MENIGEIVTTLRVDTSRVAVRSTDRLGVHGFLDLFKFLFKRFSFLAESRAVVKVPVRPPLCFMAHHVLCGGFVELIVTSFLVVLYFGEFSFAPFVFKTQSLKRKTYKWIHCVLRDLVNRLR
jgi:hypothetical protein